MLTRYRILSGKQRKASKKAHERYQGLSEEVKKKKCVYAREWNRNFSEEEKFKNRQHGPEYYKNPYDKDKQVSWV